MLNFLVGLQQTWINVELAKSIRDSFKQIHDQNSNSSRNFIHYGRLCIVIFCALFALVITVVCIAIQLTKDLTFRINFSNKALSWFVTTMFSVDFTLLTLSLIAVFYYLSKQEKLAEDIQAFKKEKCTLITILLIFDSSFIARVIFNLLYSGALSL